MINFILQKNMLMKYTNNKINNNVIILTTIISVRIF